MSTPWNYFKKFDAVSDEYLPATGEGENMATQIVTAVTKLIYRWFNDGDVYDNTYHLDGWSNDLSPFANWLYTHCKQDVRDILDRISDCDEDSYSDLLADLADTLLDEMLLESYAKILKQGSIYDCYGPFICSEDDDYDDYDDEYYDEYEDYDY